MSKSYFFGSREAGSRYRPIDIWLALTNGGGSKMVFDKSQNMEENL